VSDEEKRRNILAKIGALSGKDEDFEELIQQVRKTQEQRDAYDLIELLADAEKMEQARIMCSEMLDPYLTFRGYLYIASISKDSRDFNSALAAIEANYEADDYDKRNMISDVAAALTKIKKYKWAHQLADKGKYREEEIGRMAKSAFEARDYSEAFQLALEADKTQIASDIINVFIEKADFTEARSFADKLKGISCADYFRAYAYLGIWGKTDDQEDYKKVLEAATLCCKNDSKQYSSNLMMDLAFQNMDTYLAGRACDEILGANFSIEIVTERVLHNLDIFKKHMKERIK